MTKDVIVISDLQKSYGDNFVLRGCDLTIKEWDFFALLGYNGSGKSTTINILTNLTKKDAGKVYINGLDIDTHFREARMQIGVVPQEFNLDIFSTVWDTCIIQAGYYGIDSATARARLLPILEKLHLIDKREDQVRSLSGGMKRRLMIARALVHKPKILILDEPTAGVDIELRKSFWEFIKELNASGTTILLTTHYLEEVEALCKNVAILSEGKIVETTRVSDILEKLESETLILETVSKNCVLSPELERRFQATLLPDGNISLVLQRGENLNQVFHELDTAHITISSIRTTQSKIETLFLQYHK